MFILEQIWKKISSLATYSLHIIYNQVHERNKSDNVEFEMHCYIVRHLMFFNSRKSEIRCRAILGGPGGGFCLAFLMSSISQLLFEK